MSESESASGRARGERLQHAREGGECYMGRGRSRLLMPERRRVSHSRVLFEVGGYCNDARCFCWRSSGVHGLVHKRGIGGVTRRGCRLKCRSKFLQVSTWGIRYS